ncbi:MAG TPA: protein kinase [Longimicrobiaceae bacterium]|nr:protein kinase [Longimicrobiaceae bacterium]
MREGNPPHEGLGELESEYEVLGEIGRGGMAVVYHARDKAHAREVAIKLIRAKFVDDDETIARFARETQTVQRLQHPNIVATYEAKQLSDGSLALVMEHVPGRTLREILEAEGALDFEHAQRVMHDIASALSYAHQLGIIHRDIKPENVCINETTGAALLSDFGIAKSTENQTRLTLTGSVLGTPSYMSPEQIDGLQVDARTDIYSLGVIGWEMLSGTRPWAGEGVYGVIYKQKHEDLPPLDTERPDTPAKLWMAVEGALRKKREERWASMEDFLAQLDPDAEGRTSRAAVRRRQRVVSHVLLSRQRRGASVAGTPWLVRQWQLPSLPDLQITERLRASSPAAVAAGVLLVGAGAALASFNGRPSEPATEVASAEVTSAPALLPGDFADVSAPAAQPEPPSAPVEPPITEPPAVSEENAEEEKESVTAVGSVESPGASETPATPASAPLKPPASSAAQAARTPPPAPPAREQPATPAATPSTKPERRAPARVAVPTPVALNTAAARQGLYLATPVDLPPERAATGRRAQPADCNSSRFDPYGQHQTTDARCSIQLAVGESFRMRVAAGPLSVDRRPVRRVAWSSSNPSVAVVDREGVVRALRPGGATITASSGEMGGTATIRVVTGAPAQRAIAGGDGQVGPVGRALATPLVVRVTDANGNPVSGVRVAWAVTTGAGAVQVTSARTNSGGLAEARWTLGPILGAQTATATVDGLPPVTFTATANPNGEAQPE